MAKPNYAFEKRKKELDKKRKQEEKRLSKLQRKKDGGDATAAEGRASGPTAGV